MPIHLNELEGVALQRAECQGGEAIANDSLALTLVSDVIVIVTLVKKGEES